MKTIFKIMALSLSIFLLNGCKTTLGKTIEQYGYNELRPPTNLVPPGTVIDVEQKNPVLLSIVCSQKSAFGKEFSVPESATYNIELVKAVSKKFEVDAGLFAKIKLNPKFTSVKDITLKISNARIAQLSADIVWANVINRHASCQMAIDNFIQDKRNVTLVTSVLIADVKYIIDFERTFNLSASAKQEVLKDLSVELGLGHEASGSQDITGTGLIWGVKTDARLPLVRDDRSVDSAALIKVITASTDAAVKQVKASAGQACDVTSGSYSIEACNKSLEQYTVDMLVDPKQAVPINIPEGGRWTASVSETPGRYSTDDIWK